MTDDLEINTIKAFNAVFTAIMAPIAFVLEFFVVGKLAPADFPLHLSRKIRTASGRPDLNSLFIAWN